MDIDRRLALAADSGTTTLTSGSLPDDSRAQYLDRERLYQQQAAEENRKNRRDAAASIMGPRYVSATFERFVLAEPLGSEPPNVKAGIQKIRARQEAVLKAAHEYARSIAAMVKQGTNLIFAGPVGTGKDFFAAAVAKYEPTIEWGRTGNPWMTPLVHRTGAQLFGDIRSTMSGNGAESENSILRKLQQCGILLLSDPTPPGAGTLTEFQRSALYSVIDYRYRNLKPTICTINAGSLTELDVQLSPQIADRMLDGAIVLECNWPSFRRPLKSIAAAKPEGAKV